MRAIGQVSLLINECVARSLKPGGWVEFQEFAGTPFSDDGTLHPDGALTKFFGLVAQAVSHYGMTFRASEGLGELLENAGFVNVSRVTFKVPIGTWAKDVRLRLIGMYNKVAMSNMFGAMAAKPFLSLDMEPMEIELLLAEVRKEMNDPRIHTYQNLYFWMGQRPEAA
jgi:hypothetical protein